MSDRFNRVYKDSFSSLKLKESVRDIIHSSGAHKVCTRYDFPDKIILSKLIVSKEIVMMNILQKLPFAKIDDFLIS